MSPLLRRLGATLRPRRREVDQLADDGVVDAEIACGRGCTVEVSCGDNEDHGGPCWPSPYSLAQRALNGAAVNRPHLLEHMRAVWSAIVNAPSGEVYVVGQVWLTEVLAAAQHTSGEPLTLEDVLTLVRGLEQRRVNAVREGDRIARNLDRTQAELREVRERVRAAAEPPGYGRPMRAGGWVSGPAPSCVHGYRLTDSCPGCDALDEQGGPTPVEDPWCSADLDGAHCARPAEHTEPCRPVEGPPMHATIARCVGADGQCALVAGHQGEHDRAAV